MPRRNVLKVTPLMLIYGRGTYWLYFEEKTQEKLPKKWEKKRPHNWGKKEYGLTSKGAVEAAQQLSAANYQVRYVNEPNTFWITSLVSAVGLF